jgi:hypothetical protein
VNREKSLGLRLVGWWTAMLRSGLEWGGLHQKVSTTNHTSSICSKLGTLNQHGFPPGISPTIKQVPSLEGLL